MKGRICASYVRFAYCDTPRIFHLNRWKNREGGAHVKTKPYLWLMIKFLYGFDITTAIKPGRWARTCFALFQKGTHCLLIPHFMRWIYHHLGTAATRHFKGWVSPVQQISDSSSLSLFSRAGWLKRSDWLDIQAQWICAKHRFAAEILNGDFHFYQDLRQSVYTVNMNLRSFYQCQFALKVAVKPLWNVCSPPPRSKSSSCNFVIPPTSSIFLQPEEKEGQKRQMTLMKN